MRFTRVTIIRITAPKHTDVNEELQWFGHSLGLFSVRDKDKSCFRIFITLIKSLKARKALTSDEIAAVTQLTRGTVVHHLNKLMESGIVVTEKNRYYLNVESLEDLVDLMEHNI
ncbi:MAG: helix-turn-helix domain-containing protein, partial [Nanoarchaeota archaeon]|nr:helix-turn-helix domain-containing protein [Nanoarchaeota archaeon]